MGEHEAVRSLYERLLHRVRHAGDSGARYAIRLERDRLAQPERPPHDSAVDERGVCAGGDAAESALHACHGADPRVLRRSSRTRWFSSTSTTPTRRLRLAGGALLFCKTLYDCKYLPGAAW